MLIVPNHLYVITFFFENLWSVYNEQDDGCDQDLLRLSYGFYKEKLTEISWQYAHLHFRNQKQNDIPFGGGQNANNICKNPFDKPIWWNKQNPEK